MLKGISKTIDTNSVKNGFLLNRIFFPILLGFLLTALAGNTGFSQTRYVCGSGGDWFDAGKWTPNGIPGALDTAEIKGATVTLDSNATVSAFELRNGAILTGSAILTVTDSLTWLSGDMTGTGATRIGPGAGALVSQGSSIIDLDMRTLENFGTLVWQGTGAWKLKQQAQIFNRPGAVFEIQRDGILDFVQDWNGGSFLNEGTLKKTAGAARVEIDPLFTNAATGQVLSYSGNLRFERGSATPSNGYFYAAPGAIIQISERTFMLDDAEFSGPGAIEIVDLATVEIIGSGLTVDSPTTLRMNTNNSGGIGFLRGDGPLMVNGTLDWVRGIIAGSGNLILNGSLITSAGGSRVLDGRTLTNNGFFYLSEAIGLANNAVVANQAGAVLEVQNNQSIIMTDAIGGSIDNAGMVLKNDAGVSTIEVDFNNSGILDIEAGTLAFDQALTNSTAGIIKGNGNLDISNAVFSNAGVVAPGASPGILSVNGNYSQTASAGLNVEIGGTVAGTNYDRLTVSGSAQLDGALNITLTDDFRPAPTDTFSIMKFSSLNGLFAAENIPVIDGQNMFEVQYLAEEVLLITTYVYQFTLTVDTVGSGRVELSPYGGRYDSLDVVTLTAIADSGYVFSGWSGDLSGSNNPDSLVMDTVKSVTAAFEKIAPLVVNVNAFLEGPYQNNSMKTTVRDSGGLPLAQPYNVPPWNYSGLECVNSIPADVVDWVLAGLRFIETGVDVSYRAAFIKSDGSVVDTSGSGGVEFEGVAYGDYFVVIYHRNHLGIMSGSALPLSEAGVLYDFSAASTQAYGSNSMAEVETGVFAMISGDGNSDGTVDEDDKLPWRSENGTPWSYSKGGDYNLDGGIDVLDLNYCWRTNNGSQSGVPGVAAVTAPLTKGAQRGEKKFESPTGTISKSRVSNEASGARNIPEKQAGGNF